MNYPFPDTDRIICETVETYLKSKFGNSMPTGSQEALHLYARGRDVLYSEIIHRLPRVARVILHTDMTENSLEAKNASGLYFSISKHVMDPVFIQLLMQYLGTLNSQEDNAIIGALLTKILSKYIEEKTKKEETPKKKAEKGAKIDETDQKIDLSEVQHIQTAVNQLLGNIASLITVRCGNLTQPEAIAIAACVGLNNEDTITEIYNSELPVTASVFDILENPSNIIGAALRLEQKDFVKNTPKQQAFLDSLRDWVYAKLNMLQLPTCERFVLSQYKTATPDVAKYLIQLKDCGTAYPNLLVVGKQITNNRK